MTKATIQFLDDYCAKGFKCIKAGAILPSTLLNEKGEAIFQIGFGSNRKTIKIPSRVFKIISK